MTNLESIWNDIPVRLYPFLLNLAKQYSLAFVIDFLYDPSQWGYTYMSPTNSFNISSGNLNNLLLSPKSTPPPVMRSLNSSQTRLLSPKVNQANIRYSQILSPSKMSKLNENLKILNEKVIFLPNELPDHPPPNIDEILPPNQPRTIGRIYDFEKKIPSHFFSRLQSQLYKICTIRASWRTGIILDNCHLQFPVRRTASQQQPNSPQIQSKHLRRSSTFNVLNSSDELVYIQLIESQNKIEISSTKMSRHILQIFDSILESYEALQYQVYIPCVHCLELYRSKQDVVHLFEMKMVESQIVKGRSYVSCPTVQPPVPIKLAQLVPDLTMTDLLHKLIDFKELDIEPTPIGEGGTATVYKGKWRGNNVAIKMLKTEVGSFTKVFADFRREIFCMSSFIHENILDMKGFCMEPLCIITEFMSGGNLYDYIHKLSNPLDWNLRLKIATEIASALQTLHETKPSILHRDLKSPNILLSSMDPTEMSSQICDFSLSGFSTTVASRGGVENPVWLAPEVIANDSCSDKSDVYSFGVIMYELLTRSTFFGDISFMSTVELMICEGQRPPLPDNDMPQFNNLISSAWHQDPNQRPTFTEILRQLSEIENHLTKQTSNQQQSSPTTISIEITPSLTTEILQLPKISEPK